MSDNDGDAWVDCDDADCSTDEACITGCEDIGFCRVFVSSTTNIPGNQFMGTDNADTVDNADQLCQNLADNSTRATGGTFLAWIGTTSPDINPANRTEFTKSTVPPPGKVGFSILGL